MPQRDVADPVARFFASLAERPADPLLRKAAGTMRFDLSEPGKVERWFVTLGDDVAVSRRNQPADCVVAAERALFERIVSGRANALAAVLREEVVVEGNVNLLVLLQRVLPGPPRRRRSR